MATEDFFLDKGHPTARGYAVIAAAVQRAIEENGLLPGVPAPKGP